MEMVVCFGSICLLLIIIPILLAEKLSTTIYIMYTDGIRNVNSCYKSSFQWSNLRKHLVHSLRLCSLITR